MVANGAFRDDLFYRLNVFPIRVPPLRERKSDIPLLANVFLRRLSRKLGKRLDGLSTTAVERLLQYPWPGNVRELQNVIERAAITAEEPTVEVDDHLTMLPQPHAARALPSAGTLEEMERHYVQQVLEATDWVIEGKQGAAVILGLKPSTLRLRMQKLNIKRPPSGKRS